jgi:chemotaxis protein methyltransferase CheR
VPSLPSTDPSAVPEEDRRHLESIRQWIYSQTGLQYGPRKYVLLYKRLQAFCWRSKIQNLAELDERLHGPTAAQIAPDLVCVVSTHHTFFFREPAVLHRFQQSIIPSLPAKERWRVWSAATSSGEEAYTVAILVGEALGWAQALERCAVLGTDLSASMVGEAERGVYPSGRLELVSPDQKARCFEHVTPDKWQVSATLRQMCTFRRLNLQTTAWPFNKPFHVILCRNVFYYFDLDHQQQLAERLYDAASPDGWLITSVTETMHGLQTRWRRVQAGIFHKE